MNNKEYNDMLLKHCTECTNFTRGYFCGHSFMGCKSDIPNPSKCVLAKNNKTEDINDNNKR